MTTYINAVSVGILIGTMIGLVYRVWSRPAVYCLLFDDWAAAIARRTDRLRRRPSEPGTIPAVDARLLMSVARAGSVSTQEFIAAVRRSWIQAVRVEDAQ